MGSHTRLRQDLIDAALECFSSYGVRKTQLSDVAQRAGVSRATAYRAFAAKPDLIAAVVESEIARFIDGYRQAVDLTAAADTVLRDTMPFVLEWVRNHPVLARVLADEPEQFLELLVQEGDRLTAIDVMRPAAEVGLSQADPRQLRATPVQVAEWSVRILLSFILIPRTTLNDVDQIADLCVYGVWHPQDSVDSERGRQS